MKMTRKLIPALVMLLVSAIMLSTASFAWFASNDKVTATNMSVTANSAQQFLQISATNGDDYDITATATASSQNVDLVHATIANDKKTVTWGVGSSTDVDDANVDSDLTNVEVSSQYALINTFYLKLSAGSTGSLTDILARQITVNANDCSIKNALRILIVGSNGAMLYSYRDAADGKITLTVDGSNSATVLVSELTTDETEEIKVYAYFDGADADANTAAATKLTAMSFEIVFATQSATI
ncbi:MAG: hypothetical protein IKV20_00505 [Clostridia bacterium]|nr:hypothetical protein [Clostridia bacterium]